MKIDFITALTSPSPSLDIAAVMWCLPWLRNTLCGFTNYTVMKLVNGSLEFLRRVSRRRCSAQRGVASISDYIEESAALLTVEYLDELRAELPLLNT